MKDSQALIVDVCDYEFLDPIDNLSSKKTIEIFEKYGIQVSSLRNPSSGQLKHGLRNFSENMNHYCPKKLFIYISGYSMKFQSKKYILTSQFNDPLTFPDQQIESHGVSLESIYEYFSTQLKKNSPSINIIDATMNLKSQCFQPSLKAQMRIESQLHDETREIKRGLSAKFNAQFAYDSQLNFSGGIQHQVDLGTRSILKMLSEKEFSLDAALNMLFLISNRRNNGQTTIPIFVLLSSTQGLEDGTQE